MFFFIAFLMCTIVDIQAMERVNKIEEPSHASFIKYFTQSDAKESLSRPSSVHASDRVDNSKESSSRSPSPQKNKQKYVARLELPKESLSGSSSPQSSPHSSPKKHKKGIYLDLSKGLPTKGSSSKSSESPRLSPKSTSKEKLVYSDISSIESPNRSVSPQLSPKEKKSVRLDMANTEESGGQSSARKAKYFSASTGSPSVSKESPSRLSKDFDAVSKTPRKIPNPIKKHSNVVENNNYSVVELELLKAIEENNTAKVQDILHPNTNIADPYGRTPLITSIKNGNDTLVKELLAQQNIDVNKTDTWGNTPLHHAVLQDKVSVIKLLLGDYRVNSLLKNKNGDFAHQLINKDYRDMHENTQFLLLRALIFARFTLDLQVKEEAFALQLELKNNNAEVLRQAAKGVKKRILQDDKNQKDYQPIPNQSKLPDYASKDFIVKMILYRIEFEKPKIELEKAATYEAELHKVTMHSDLYIY